MNVFIKIKNNPLFLLLPLIGIFTADLALFSNMGYSGGMIFAVLILAIAAFLNLEQSYYLIAFCLPFSSVLKFSESSITIIPILYAIIILKLAFFEKQKMKLYPLIALASLAVLQIVSVAIYNSSISSVISLLLSCFFVLYSACFFSSKSNVGKNMLRSTALYLAIAVALNILLSDMFPQAMSIISASKQEALETHSRFGALLVEPNELSQVILVAVGFLVATFSSYKHIMSKVGIGALIAYLVINGIRTNSKSYVLTLFGLFCVLMLLLILRFFKKKHSAFALVGFLILLIVGAVAGYYLIYNVIVPVFEMRGDNADLLTGRDDIWQKYLEAIKQRLDVTLIGCGAGNAVALLKMTDILGSNVPHNLYIEYLVQFGIAGIVALLISWADAFNNMKGKSVLFWIPALAFLVTAFGISANSNDCIFITLMILSMPMFKCGGTDS